MEKDTKITGNIAELEVQTYMTKLGVQVSIPYGDRSRYDQIWDVNGKLLKVQVKHANFKNNTIEVRCSSIVRRNGKRANLRYTNDQVDGIATFYNGRCYYIPIDQAPRRAKTLRFDRAKSNIESTVNWATDFEVEKQLQLDASN